MLPLQDVIPSRTKPWVTLAIVAAIALVLAYELTATPAHLRTLVHTYALSSLHKRWVFAPGLVLLHTGLLHAGSNMLALWIFGDTLEDRLGHVRFAALALLGATASSAAIITGRPDALMPTVGSAGMVAAVIAAYLTQWPRSRVLVFVPVPLFVDLIEIPAAIVPGFWLLLQVLGASRGGGVSEAAQVLWAMGAGAATGALLGPLLARGRRDWWTKTKGSGVLRF